jgi:hypothetical protein
MRDRLQSSAVIAYHTMGHRTLFKVEKNERQDKKIVSESRMTEDSRKRRWKKKFQKKQNNLFSAQNDFNNC